jgi:hypothetical protein
LTLRLRHFCFFYRKGASWLTRAESHLFGDHSSSGLKRHTPLDVSQLGPHSPLGSHNFCTLHDIFLKNIKKPIVPVLCRNNTQDKRGHSEEIRADHIFLSLISSLQCRDINFLHSHQGCERTLRLGRVGIGEHPTKNLRNHLPRDTVFVPQPPTLLFSRIATI